MDTAVELKNVTKTFGKVTAIQDFDLVIPLGGLYGFIGPNGAGKTTTIRLIMSILFPDSGNISVAPQENICRRNLIKAKRPRRI